MILSVLEDINLLYHMLYNFCRKRSKPGEPIVISGTHLCVRSGMHRMRYKVFANQWDVFLQYTY